MGRLDIIDGYFDEHFDRLFSDQLEKLLLDFAKKFAQYWAKDNGKVYREINHDLKVFYDEYCKTLDPANGKQTGDPSQEAGGEAG